MHKIMLPLALLLLTLSQTQAQHCQWDNAYILMVDIRDSETGKAIPKLEVLLVDSSGTPYRSSYNKTNHKNLSFHQHTKRLQFGQNIKKKRQSYSDTKGPFPFGEGHYMILLYYNNYPSFNAQGTDYIQIRDVDGKKNLGRFEMTKLPFSKKDIVSLCTSNAIWHEETAVKAAALSVELQPVK